MFHWFLQSLGLSCAVISLTQVMSLGGGQPIGFAKSHIGNVSKKTLFALKAGLQTLDRNKSRLSLQVNEERCDNQSLGAI
jgi:hypothetical protein